MIFLVKDLYFCKDKFDYLVGIRNLKKKTNRRIHYFSLVEILIVLGVIAALAAITLPCFLQGKEKAHFVRWLAFNRQCSNDPSCILNLNFQDHGEVLKNLATGSKFEDFEASNYNGKLIGDCEWGQGRWPGKKRAIKMPGYGSIIEIKSDRNSELGTYDDYTLMTWVCFDFKDVGGTLLSKGYIQHGPPNYFGQLHVLPSMIFDKKEDCFIPNFQVLATGYEAQFCDKEEDTNKKIKIKLHEWVLLTIRNNTLNNNKKVVDFYINGRRMQRWYGQSYEDTVKVASSMWVGGVKYQNNHSKTMRLDHQGSGFGFKGRIDELILYRRALSEKEIMGHYKMGCPE